MNTQIKKFAELDYIIDYPEDYVEGERCPVIIMLHGAGYRGSDITPLLSSVYFKNTAKHERFPFISVLPQCKADTVWFDWFEQLKSLIRSVAASDYADPSRIYLMGVSMGGYAAWQVGMSMPELFAAMVPICGGGMYWNASRLKNTPVWAFHGGRDPIVKPEESEKMVNAINTKGGEARLTVYPDNLHDAWSDTFANQEVFDWLLSKTNKNSVIDTDKAHEGANFG